MGSITVTGLAMGGTGLTITSKTVPSVKTTVPVTVLSRNLLSYGPARENGLTVSVNDDGSLHVSGQTTAVNQGVKWRFPIPDDVRGKTVTYRLFNVPSGVYCYAHSRNTGGVLSTFLISDPTHTLSAEATEIEFRVATNTTNPVDGDIRVQIEPRRDRYHMDEARRHKPLGGGGGLS